MYYSILGACYRMQPRRAAAACSRGCSHRQSNRQSRLQPHDYQGLRGKETPCATRVAVAVGAAGLRSATARAVRRGGPNRTAGARLAVRAWGRDGKGRDGKRCVRKHTFALALASWLCSVFSSVLRSALLLPLFTRRRAAPHAVEDIHQADVLCLTPRLCTPLAVTVTGGTRCMARAW